MFVDAAWANSQNPNDDVAFLVVSQPVGSPKPVQELTSGENLATGWKAAQLVTVIGYPDGPERPITCTARDRPFGTRQMEFDCGGYTDGTSGGPFLANLHPATGLGAVIGVIGGYEQGGDTPSVSYSARLAGPSGTSTRPRSPRAERRAAETTLCSRLIVRWLGAGSNNRVGVALPAAAGGATLQVMMRVADVRGRIGAGG